MTAWYHVFHQEILFGLVIAQCILMVAVEVEQLMRLADAADQAEIPDGMSVPEELQRREARLAAIAQAKAAIEAQGAERYAREQAAYEQKMAERKAKEESTGRKPGGPPPAEPQPGPRPKDKENYRRNQIYGADKAPVNHRARPRPPAWSQRRPGGKKGTQLVSAAGFPSKLVLSALLTKHIREIR